MKDLESKRGSPDDRIEELLRATGRRPAVPADRTERVRATVRAHWREQLRRRARVRRRLVLGTALAAAAVVVAAVLGAVFAPRQDESMLVVAAAAGPVADELPVGSRIEAGRRLATGADGRLALRSASGRSIRLDSDTRLTVVSGRALSLERGAVYVDSGGPDEGGGEGLEVRTSLGTVSERGTQFETRLRPSSLVVRVREGAVLLDGERRRHEVAAGQQLILGADGRVSQSAIARSGAGWAWVESVAPMMEIDGRPLSEFLDWVAREKSLRLVLVGPGLAGVAEQTRLSGSIAGMTLEQALDSVLPTCGLGYRIEGETLVVRPTDASL